MKNTQQNKELRELEKCAIAFFKKNCDMEIIDNWIKNNPPPNDWHGGPYSWAYLERPGFY